MERHRILKRYFSSGFWLDLISTLPMFLNLMNISGLMKSMNFLIILKVQWVDKFFYKYFEIYNLKNKLYYSIFLKFFYIILKVIFFAHCFACIFLALAFHLDVESTWITKYSNGLPELGWFSKVKNIITNNSKPPFFLISIYLSQYVYAFYWGITTMTTVGLGDLLPANIYEVSVLSIFMFVSCGTFAYSFNAIGVILGEIN